ncbi:Aste57867_12494 [Aphanomyces stellatus]|uniref:Aste57867_12494 protein n=1 Tax=Aphanomyces stellatus TaxID=120398 RepID=A0A485KX39_9STRA|nr:hypothetical protein As57867_012448 [Aphanomyces stellatus]VFT89345.1 Aste57867_12494 [Aphanomyces stellatus]
MTPPPQSRQIGVSSASRGLSISNVSVHNARMSDIVLWMGETAPQPPPWRSRQQRKEARERRRQKRTRTYIMFTALLLLLLAVIATVATVALTDKPASQQAAPPNKSTSSPPSPSKKPPADVLVGGESLSSTLAPRSTLSPTTPVVTPATPQTSRTSTPAPKDTPSEDLVGTESITDATTSTPITSLPTTTQPMTTQPMTTTAAPTTTTRTPSPLPTTTTTTTPAPTTATQAPSPQSTTTKPPANVNTTTATIVATSVPSSTVRLLNNCVDVIQLIYTLRNGVDRVSYTEALPPVGRLDVHGSLFHGATFRKDQSTLLEVSRENGKLSYDLSVIPPDSGNCPSWEACHQASGGKVTYDVPIRVQPQNLDDNSHNNCRTIACDGPQCPAAFLFPLDDPAKVADCALDASLVVTFC